MNKMDSVPGHDDMSNWIKPNDLMRSRKLKSKRHALKARLSTLSPIQSKNRNNVDHRQKTHSGHAKNPFRCLLSKSEVNIENNLLEDSCDTTFFKFLNSSSETPPSSSTQYDFLNLSSPEPNSITKKTKESDNDQWINLLHLDWSLKTRIRFASVKPFQWKHTFKTSEEASGTTGFVRCLNHNPEAKDGRTVDTSTNAQFYQCCLVWQHPNLPLIKLYPREKQKTSPHTGMFGLDQQVVSALHSEWAESLRSLYQLLRVRQCPYFYVCSHTFTCLFRAAGAAAFPLAHALITPTTAGFRKSMKVEGVEFSMPLNIKNLKEENAVDRDETDDILEDPEGEEPTEFLENLGVESSQFPGLCQNKFIAEQKLTSIDGLPQSLVYVEDMELHSFINFLLNSSSCVSTTGPMAGVPPTLLSPVGFHGGTLKSLKVNAGSFHTKEGETKFSIDIQGPILPTTVINLCSLLSSSHDTYSASLYPLSSTVPFCRISPSIVGSPMPMAFASEGLVDCGLGEEVRKLVCKSSDESKRHGLPESFREIMYKNGQFTWTDKLQQ